jgi:hypothetical protein
MKRNLSVMTLRVGIWAGLTILAMSAAPAQSLKNITSPSPLVYSPDVIVQTTGSIRVSHENYLGPFCVVLTQISLTPSTVAPAEGLTYGLYKPDISPVYQLSLTGSPSSDNEVLSGTFDSVNIKKPFMSLGFALIVSPSSMPAPGTYVATIRADLYASAFPVSGSPVATDTLIVSVTVPSLTDVSVVPTGGSFSVGSTSADLSFGTINAGATRGVDIRVRSNVRYSVSLVSANGSALANALDGSLIPYTLSADGMAVSLPKGIASVITLSAAPTYGNPSVSGIAVTINQFSDFPVEGTYTDMVTVNVSAP